MSFQFTRSSLIRRILSISGLDVIKWINPSSFNSQKQTNVRMKGLNDTRKNGGLIMLCESRHMIVYTFEREVVAQYIFNDIS